LWSKLDERDVESHHVRQPRAKLPKQVVQDFVDRLEERAVISAA
jgi:hypothetical protein